MQKPIIINKMQILTRETVEQLKNGQITNIEKGEFVIKIKKRASH